MTSPTLPSRRASSATSPSALTGFIGGGLLLASVALSLVPFFGQSARVILFSAALLVFAFGVRGVGSVTARRPIGTAALTLLAVWLILGAVFRDVAGFGYSNWLTSDAMKLFTNLDSFATFAIALVVVVQIARVGAVPAPWKWLPAMIRAVLVVIWLPVNLIMFDSPGSYFPNPILWFLTFSDGITRIGGTMLMAVIAIVLGDRANRETPANGDSPANGTNPATGADSADSTAAAVIN